MARAEDPEGLIDLDFIWAFRLDGVETEKLRDALIEGWRADYPELAVTTETLVGKPVVRASFGDGAVGSIWYIHEGVAYDIETVDEAVGASILAALPPATAVPPSAPAASPSAAEPEAPSASAPG